MDIYLSKQTIIMFSAILTIGCFVAFVLFLFWKERRKKRYSPFTEDTLRTPGLTIRRKHNELADDFLIYYLLFIAAGTIVAIVIVTMTSLVRPIAAFSGFLGMTYIAYSLWNLFTKIQNAKLGYEGEEYTGQELNLLMCRGAHVFHDMPYKYGNIDHIVVGHDKVFAIETKAFRKPESKTKKNTKDATVRFDGQTLYFPDRECTQPLEQAKRHAEYLEKAILKNCGISFKVVPVVALPGWFVKLDSPGTDILVINPKRGKSLDKFLGSCGDRKTRNDVARYLASCARYDSADSKVTNPDAWRYYDFWINPKKVDSGLH